MHLKSDLYEINAIWSRLIHRFHTLGTTRQTYLNSIGGITEQRIYPHHIPSFKENRTTSINQDQVWQTRKWKKGWVKINEQEQTASFLFASENGKVFHKIELLPQSEWECLQCILRIFTPIKISSLDSITTKRKLFNYCFHPPQHTKSVLHLLESAVSQKKPIRFMMPTSGGFLNKSTLIENVSLRSNVINATSANSRMVIDMSKVYSVNIKHRPKRTLSTLSNRNGTPQFFIETT